MDVGIVEGGAGGGDSEKASLIPQSSSGSLGPRTVIHKHECASSNSVARVAGGIIFVASTCAGLGTGVYLIINGSDPFKIILEIIAVAIPVILIDLGGLNMMMASDDRPPAVESDEV